MTAAGALQQVAAALSSLPSVVRVQRSVLAVACLHLRDLHGQQCRGGQFLHASRAHPGLLWAARHSYSSRAAAAAAEAQPDLDGDGGGRASSSWDDALQQPGPAHPAPAAAEQQLLAEGAPAAGEALLASEGEVAFLGGPVLSHITRHWAALAACPSAAAYTHSISFGEFGSRYIKQLEAEEAARSRALEQLRRELAAEAAAGMSYKRPGGLAQRLVSAWLPLLQQAIEEEQQQVLALGRRSSGSGSSDAAASSSSSSSGGGASRGAPARRRDRPNYGPYLLLLSAEELAHITLQTVLSRVATALPDVDEPDDASGLTGSSSTTGGSGSSSSWTPIGGSSGGGSTSSSDAVMTPAVLLADAVGRGVNNRVKYLRFKAEQERLRSQRKQLRKQQEAAAAFAAAAAVAGGGGGSGSSGGADAEQLAADLARYNASAASEAAAYQAGQARLQQLASVARLGAAARKAAAAARADVRWDMETRVKVGAALLALVVEACQLPHGLPGSRPRLWTPPPGSSKKAAAAAAAARGSPAAPDSPAFEYVYVKAGLKQQACVRASTGLVALLLADRSLAAALLVKVPPMLVPPLPWSSFDRGGYLTSRHWMMRTRYSSAMQEELRRGAANKQYTKVLDALNVLGNTGWKINRQVYDVVTQLWEARSTAGGLPCQVPLRPPTPPPTHYRLVYEFGGLSARSGPWSRLEGRGATLAADEVRRLNRNMASLRADFALKLKVASDFAGAPEFFYPHTLDFRGRAYPLHPSLHHLGDDTCRGLLLFSRGVPLGQQGLDWLFVHVANVWGHGQDKLSFDGRRAFARSCLPTILEVAADPLAQTWWQGGEKPWQTLAACFEVAGALMSLDPASYVSHLPVHMDGSCNGLQHYAALGRDEQGGAAVNLLPSDKPQDVYKGVADIVARRVAADAAAGGPTAGVAGRCAGLVDRKVVKQTVMTSVYGVTAVGARAQVESRLREKRAAMKARAALHQQQQRSGSSAGSGEAGGGVGVWRDEFGWMDDKDHVWQASKYLADLTLGAIGEMFGSARAIMAWLADCARVVAASDAPVAWVSPLGLPITQPYHKQAMTLIHTTTQSFSVVAPDDTSSSEAGSGRWLKARQRSAFPPNYIHSIDSTHMMLTALACSEAGITFAGVHDSFWTHAGDVPTMNKLLRERFVELHTRQPDLLQDLLAQLTARHPDLTFPPIPQRGNLAVARVNSSRYFFS